MLKHLLYLNQINIIHILLVIFFNYLFQLLNLVINFPPKINLLINLLNFIIFIKNVFIYKLNMKVVVLIHL